MLTNAQRKAARRIKLAFATFGGTRVDDGRTDEVAILCYACTRPMLILRRVQDDGQRVWCSSTCAAEGARS